MLPDEPPDELLSDVKNIDSVWLSCSCKVCSVVNCVTYRVYSALYWSVSWVWRAARLFWVAATLDCLFHAGFRQH